MYIRRSFFFFLLWTPSHATDAVCYLNNEKISIESTDSPFETITLGDYPTVVLNASKNLYYIPNFLNTSIMEELIGICTSQNRFIASPLRGKDTPDQDSKTTSTRTDTHRTSESCTMVPASTYLSNPKFQSLRTQPSLDDRTSKIIREVDIGWDIAQKASSVVHSDPELVEPLQIVRYTSPQAEYKLHHDHGGFYGSELERRPYTILVYLNDVEKGGMTSFPQLGLRIAPRRGNAVVWSNVRGGEVDEDMVHAGEPPEEEGVEKYAMNIWLREGRTLKEDKAAQKAGKWGGQWQRKSEL